MHWTMTREMKEGAGNFFFFPSPKKKTSQNKHSGIRVPENKKNVLVFYFLEIFIYIIFKFIN